MRNHRREKLSLDQRTKDQWKRRWIWEFHREKEIGEILSWLLDQVLEQPELNERETLTELVREKRDEQ